MTGAYRGFVAPRVYASRTAAEGSIPGSGDTQLHVYEAGDAVEYTRDDTGLSTDLIMADNSRWRREATADAAVAAALAAQAAADAASAAVAALPLNNLTATRAPLPTDDAAAGYAVGSRWLWGGQEWVAASVGGGAARWLSNTQITPDLFGAPRNGGDDAAAFRAAIAFLTARGGGTLHLRDGVYNLLTTETRTAYVTTGTSDGILVSVSVQSPFFVPAGVSIIGPGRDACTLDASQAPSAMAAGIGTWDYSNGVISGFRLQGKGATVNAAHGLHISYLSTAAAHTNRNVALRDLWITDWASYGLGYQYGAPVNVTVEDVLIEDTGADGVDWKVRFGPGDPDDAASGVSMNRVTVRRPGQRVATSISGLGIRGRAQLSNIEVTGLKAGCDGVQMAPGTGIGDELRQPAARSTLTNFYIEGDDPAAEVIGLNCFSSGPMSISNGYLRGCQVQTQTQTTTPTFFAEGPTISNVTVDGVRAYDAFLFRAPRTQMIGCRSLSEKAYFEAKRGNLAEGQTVLTVPRTITTPTIVVVKNGATMAGGYTFAGNDVTLAVPALATDVFVVVQPSRRPYRVEAEYCGITGGGSDAYHTETTGLASTGTVQASMLVVGFYNERLPNITVRATTAAIIEPVSPNADEDLRLFPKGNALVRFGTHTASADAAVAGYITVKDSGGVSRKLAVIP